MSSPQSSTVFAAFTLDSSNLSKSAINTVRATLGISGVVALIVGILITFWPKNSALVQSGDSPSRGWTIFFGILSVVAGIIVLFSPLWGAVVLFVIAGIALIVLGIIQIVRAFTFGRGAGGAAATA